MKIEYHWMGYWQIHHTSCPTHAGGHQTWSWELIYKYQLICVFLINENCRKNQHLVLILTSVWDHQFGDENGCRDQILHTRVYWEQQITLSYLQHFSLFQHCETNKIEIIVIIKSIKTIALNIQGVPKRYCL